MDELIASLRNMREGLRAEYSRLQEAFKAESDVDKMNALDTKIAQLGNDLVALESKLLSAEAAAKKSTFDPGRFRQLAKTVVEHNEETARAVKEYSDSIEQANYLASRVSSAMKLAGEILRKA